jgi:hypothetical protein
VLVARFSTRKHLATSPHLPASDVKEVSHFYLASSARGREDPKTLSTIQTPPPSLVLTPPSVYRHVHVCYHFHNHFLRRYVSSLLDPNVYAQDDDLVALDS